MDLERVNGFAFEWHVADGRHEVLTSDDEWAYWVPHINDESSITDDMRLSEALILGSLIAQPIPSHEQGYRPYNPLADCPGLHRKFASLPLATEPEGATDVFKHYCDFAAQYGLLEGGGVAWRTSKRAMPVMPVKRVGDITLDKWAASVELLGVWDEEIHWFREVIRVWDGIQYNQQDLREVIRWSEGGSSVWYQHPEQRVLGRSRQPGEHYWAENRRPIGPDGKTPIAGPAAWRAFTTLDTKDPARAWLTSELNVRLAGHVSPSLTPADPPRVLFVPNNLRDAMVVMLFLEVSGQSDLRQCAYCNHWFDAAGMRADAKYCKPSCKTQASRRRGR